MPCVEPMRGISARQRPHSADSIFSVRASDCHISLRLLAVMLSRLQKRRVSPGFSGMNPLSPGGYGACGASITHVWVPHRDSPENCRCTASKNYSQVFIANLNAASYICHRHRMPVALPKMAADCLAIWNERSRIQLSLQRGDADHIPCWQIRAHIVQVFRSCTDLQSHVLWPGTCDKRNAEGCVPT